MKIILSLLLLTSAAWSKTINFNQNWQFRKNAEQNWSKVTLPHTAHLEPYVSNDMWMGTVHYKKVLAYNKKWNGKKVFLDFEGAMSVAKVSINGKVIKTHFGGYVGFEVDLTKHLKKSSKNIIEVELDNGEKPDLPPGKPYRNLDFAWFSGLYRNVKLTVKSPLYISHPISANKAASGGVFARYSKDDSSISIDTHLINDFSKQKNFKVKQSLYFGKKKVAEITSSTSQINKNSDQSISQVIKLSQAKLWSPQRPNLYTLRTSLMVGSKTLETYSQKIGLKHVKINADGCYINGKKMYLRGTNRHQEYPYVGYAASDRAQYRDAQLIKEAGYDLVRLSHYPQSPAFMRACDELGLLVIDCITGWQWYKNGKFAERSLQEAREMMRRNRNHVSVIMWETSLNESGMPDWFLKKMHDIVDEEYPGEQSLSISWNGKYHDIFGPARQHSKGPHYWNDWQKNKQAIFVAEYGDWEYYAHNAANFNQKEATKSLKGEERSSRQLRKAGEKRMLQMAMNYQESHNHNQGGKSIIGDANWLMFDYNRGYSNDHCTSGVMDLMRLPKFAYYFYKSQRSPSEKTKLFDSGPMVFAATYWTKDSNPKVRVFSNCDTVVAYLNGKKVTQQKPDKNVFSTNLKHPPFTFDLKKFQAGEVKFIGLINGKKVASHTVKTPKAAKKLKLFTHKTKMKLKADSNDFIFLYAAVVDENGTVVPSATHELTFTVNGAAKILGPSSIKAEAGINGVLLGQVRSNQDLTVSVSADGLESTEMKIKVTK